MRLEAQTRNTGGARELRDAGRLPAVMYNRDLNVAVSVELRAFDKVFRSQGTAAIIDLEVDGTVHPVLVKQVQMNKRMRVPMHVDFYAVTEGQEVEVNLPIELTGSPQGVRDGGLLDVHRREVRIAVMPTLIPSNVVVDVSAVVIGESLHISDLVPLLPPEARILDDLELTLLSVVPPRVEEEAEATEAAGEEPQVINRGAEGEDSEDEG